MNEPLPKDSVVPVDPIPAKPVVPKWKRWVRVVVERAKRVKLPQKRSSRIRLALLTPVAIVGWGVMVFYGFGYLKRAVTKVVHDQQTSEAGKPPEGFTKLNVPEREPAFFTLKPKTERLFGILPQEIFVLTSRAPISETELKQIISTSVQLEIKPVSEMEYELKPASPFGKDQNVVVQINSKDKIIGSHTLDRNYSWAFQTQPDFEVTSTIPGDKKTEVPVNTGIEFSFNQNDFADGTNYISISPKIKFRTENHDQTLAIVPLEPLQPETTYTVTLRRGFNLLFRNDPLELDHTITFQTAPAPEITFHGKITPSDSYLEFTPRDQAQIKVNTYGWNKDTQIKAEVYRFASVESFVDSRKEVDAAESSWWKYYANPSVTNTEGLSKVLTADVTVQTLQAEPNNVDYVQLPEALPVGLYLAEFTYGDNKKVQVWLQSTFLSGYVNVGRKETLVWLNTIEQDAPVDLASIQLLGLGQSYQTNNEGVAIFGTPDGLFTNGKHYLEAKTADSRELVLPTGVLDEKSAPGKTSKNDYWSYLYNERRMYLPGDTVNFWGVIKNRDSNSPPGQITVSVTKGYSYNDQKPEVLVSTVVSPQGDGSFVGKVKLPDSRTGWYNLTLLLGDTPITESYLEITKYQKPEMKIEVSSDKKAVFAGESVEHKVQVGFFDGTPASQLPLNVSSQFASGPTTPLTTDDYGMASFTQQTKYTDDYRQYPRYEGVSFFPGTAQDHVEEGYGSVQIFGSQYLMKVDRQQEGSKAKFTATLNWVDLGPINRGESDKVLGAAAGNVDISMKITKTWYEKVEEGTYYNFIEKITQPKFRYERKTEVTADQTLKTDGNGQVSYDFDLEMNKSYQVDLVATDSQGRKEARSTYFYYSAYRGYSGAGQDKPQLTLKNEDNVMDLGETIAMEIREDDKLLATNEKTRILYTLAHEGRQSYILSTEPILNIPFSREYVPNITLGALIYDGRNYQQATGDCNYDWYCGDYYYGGAAARLTFGGINLAYNQEQSKLDVAITASKPKYKPGERAEIYVTVTKNGQPVGGASVNLAVVDQALAAIGGVREPSILSTLYKYVPIDMFFTYYSHRQLVPDPSMAERGGGGGNRDIFKDTPFFGTATTNSDGKATFSFDLADNITTWLVYSQAVTSDLDAGHSAFSVPASLDYFVTSNFPPSIIQADKAKVALNSFGRGVSSGTGASFSVMLNQGGQTLKELKVSGPVFKETSVDLAGLATGEYKVTSRAAAAGLEDGLTLPLEVMSTRLALMMGEGHALKAGESLNKLNDENVDKSRAVKFLITDAGKGEYYWRLRQLCSQSSNRVEKTIARQAALPLVDKYFDPQMCSQTKTDLRTFQNDDGGLALVSWGSSDLAASTWSVYVDESGQLDGERLKEYFNSALTNSKASRLGKIQATWALAMLGEPETINLQRLAQQAVTYSEKVTAAIALASTGNTEQAREMYLDLLADHAYQNLGTIRMEDCTGTMQPVADRYLVDTSNALLLSSLLDYSYTKEMYGYITQYRTNLTDQVLDLAEVAYMKRALSILPNEDTQVALTSKNQSVQKTLTKGRAVTLPLPAGDVANFNLKVTAGVADVYAQYWLTPQSVGSEPENKNLRVSRKYYNVTDSNKELKSGDVVNVGDIIKIELAIDVDKNQAPKGRYQVTDILPSGLRLIDNPSQYGLTGANYFSQTTDQVNDYYFYNSDWWQLYGDKNIVYFARASHLGEYVAEPASIQSQNDLSFFDIDEPMTIQVTSKSN